jgi:hypothetical protein
MVRVRAALLGMLLAGLSSCADRGPDAVTGIWSRSYALEALDCVGVIGFSDGGAPAGSWYTKEGCPYNDTEAGYHLREGTYVILADDSLSLTTLRGSCPDDRRETRTVSFSRSGGSLTLVDGTTTNAYAAISGETVLFPGHSLVRGCFVGTPLFFEAYPLTDLPLPDGGGAPD